MENASARNLWGDYLDKHLEHAFTEAPQVFIFVIMNKTPTNAPC